VTEVVVTYFTKESPVSKAKRDEQYGINTRPHKDWNSDSKATLTSLGSTDSGSVSLLPRLHTNMALLKYHNVTYLRKSRTVKPLLGNGSANTPVATQQICDTQQWSSWEAVFSYKVRAIAM
jgi:hypothetical protein